MTAKDENIDFMESHKELGTRDIKKLFWKL